MRTLLTAIVLIFPGAIAAQSLDPDRLRSLMIEGNFADAEIGLEAVYAEVREGTVSHDDQRQLYVVFSTTHPEIGKTVDAWLNARPRSIHARTAKGWQQYHLSWIARGERGIRFTHPKAIEAMYTHWFEFRQHMWSVFEDDPAFVPGSDGVLRSFLNGGRKSELVDVMDVIMEVSPSRGSMDRALHSLSPRWGGSEQAMRALCSRHADKVADDDGYDVERCNVVSAFDEDLRGKSLEWAVKRLETIPEDEEPYAHLYAATRLEPEDRPTSDQVLAWYRAWGGYDQRIVSSIERNYRVYNFVAEEKERKLSEDAARLDNDPLNPELLLDVSWGRYHYELPDDEKAELYRMIQKAQILGSREPRVWLALANYHEPKLHVDTYPITREYYEKAIVYSNYQPFFLLRYFENLHNWRENILIALERASEGYDITGEGWKHVAADPRKQLDEIDCDYIRAARWTDTMCQNTGQCFRGDGHIQIIIDLMAAEGDDRLCPANYEVGLEELVYPEQP